MVESNFKISYLLSRIKGATKASHLVWNFFLSKQALLTLYKKRGGLVQDLKAGAWSFPGSARPSWGYSLQPCVWWWIEVLVPGVSGTSAQRRTPERCASPLVRLTLILRVFASSSCDPLPVASVPFGTSPSWTVGHRLKLAWSENPNICRRTPPLTWNNFKTQVVLRSEAIAFAFVLGRVESVCFWFHKARAAFVTPRCKLAIYSLFCSLFFFLNIAA